MCKKYGFVMFELKKYRWLINSLENVKKYFKWIHNNEKRKGLN